MLPKDVTGREMLFVMYQVEIATACLGIMLWEEEEEE